MMLPQEFLNRMKEQLGDEFDGFAASYELPAQKALRLNRRKIGTEDFGAVAGYVIKDGICEVPHWPGAYYYDSGEPGKSPLHEAGAYYIQEPSAMLPVTMLDASDSGQKILDLCAAPGGKTTQTADLMNGKGILVANEIIPNRASVLSENIERMGVTNALVISEDPQKLKDRFAGYFDRILVDAPCSGEGMFRRNPEAVNEWNPENVQMCADRQDMILDCAAEMLAPGGKIVYSTCTFSPEEDEGSMQRFCKCHPEFEICDGPVRLYPHTFKGEGHFAVSFVRSFKESVHNPEGAAASGNARVHADELAQFFNDTFRSGSPVRDMTENNRDRLVSFGDSLYLAPEHMPDIKGLKVLRCGLKLGTFKKNRFEPDHALSHALKTTDVKFFADFGPDSVEIGKYLSGETVACSSDMKGWCLVCVNGFPVGWGKAGGGIIKNHYPKGLRL